MSLAGKTVLVTGGTGFLGGEMVHRLAQEGAQVRALARKPERAKYIQGLPGVEVVQGDITAADKMREVVQGCEYVFHVAAATDGPMETQCRMNVEGTRNTAEAAAQAGVKRFIHVSTISVYVYGETTIINEDTSFSPSNDPYNVTKAEAETELRKIGAKNQMTYSIIRPGMIYGPRSGLWTGQLFRLAKINPTPFLGDGSGSVFPIYVDDVVDLMTVLAAHSAAENEAFNCAPDPAPTWREFLGAYAGLAGHQSWFGFPFALAYPFALLVGTLAKPGTQAKDLPRIFRLSQRKVRLSMDKARERLGWQARVSLEDGVQRCAPWLREKGLLH